MPKKAQGLVEVCLLAAFVAILTFTVWTVYNNQKFNLTNMSRSGINGQSVNLTEMETNLRDPRWSQTVPYNGVETAGGLSLLGGMSSGTFSSLMSNITYAQLDAALKTKVDDESLLDRVNALKEKLGINFRTIVKEDINTDTLSVFTEILNKISELTPEEMYAAGISEDEVTTYLSTVKGLLDEAKSTMIASSSSTSTNNLPASPFTSAETSGTSSTSYGPNNYKSSDGDLVGYEAEGETGDNTAKELLLNNPTAPPMYYNGMNGFDFMKLNSAGKPIPKTLNN